MNEEEFENDLYRTFLACVAILVAAYKLNQSISSNWLITLRAKIEDGLEFWFGKFLEEVLGYSAATNEFANYYSKTQPVFNRYIDTLITELDNNTRQTIISSVQRLTEAGYPPNKVAQDIKGILGLTRPQSEAYIRRMRALRVQGIPEKRIERIMGAFYRKKLKERSKTIARTEAYRLINLGKLQAWREAVNSNLVDPVKARKVWVIHPDEKLCPICARIDEMGETPAIEEMFNTPLGQMLMPPAHPNCRCHVKLIFT